MQPGALRALEFDRIVEAVRGFALTPMGDERLARLAPSTDPQQVAQLLAATTETVALSRRDTALFPLRALERSAADPRGARRRGPRARSAAAARARRRSSTRSTRRAPPSAARRHRFRCSTPPAAARRRSRARSAQTRDKIDPSGEVVDHASPELQVDSRAAAQAADAAARHARVVPARQGHGEVPAGAGRHRAQRPLRARRARPSTAAAFRASCTARRRAARACSSSRSAPSRSTTTSSRSRSRKPRRSGASCSR